MWLDDQRFAEYAAHLERQDWEEEVEEYFSSFLQKKWRHHDHDHCYEIITQELDTPEPESLLASLGILHPILASSTSSVLTLLDTPSIIIL